MFCRYMRFRRLASKACRTLVLALCFVAMGVPAQAQIMGDFTSSISPDTFAIGDAQNGFGFAALRREDKLRMQRLRERYRELNPVNKGIVEVYDIETSIKNDDAPTHETDN